MRLLVGLIASAPALVSAAEIGPCSFSVGHGSLGRELAPYWFVVTGKAEVEIKGKVLRARFFDSRAPQELSHEFMAALSRPPGTSMRVQASLTARLRTQGTDSGDDALTGSFAAVPSNSGTGQYVLHSLVAHNAFSYVGISCYAKSPV